VAEYRDYFIWTIGCQMNKADSERIAGALDAAGYLETDDEKHADIIVLNTCSVREHAESRLWGKLSELAHLKRERPHLIVGMTGCAATGSADIAAIKRRYPFIDVFFNAINPGELLRTIEAKKRQAQDGLAESDGVASAQPAPARGPEPLPVVGVSGPAMTARTIPRYVPEVPLSTFKPASTGAVSRYVPVIYGCNMNCTYCIVPFRRGREWSRPVEEILLEAQAFAAQGARELILLGQIVDAYGHDLPGRPSLAWLLGKLNDLDGIYRLRFITSHPLYMNDELINAVATLDKVCEEINIPVQSGDDAILRSMRRGYTVQRYRDIVARIRDRIPGVAISTDVIVGYPGETEAQFENTLRLLDDLKLDVVHVAAFSPRPGTPAASMPDSVPPEEKKRRLHEVEKLQEQIAAAINARLQGQVVEVLVEELSTEGPRRVGGPRWKGRTRTNKLVFFSDPYHDWRGKLVEVRIDYTSPWSLIGTVLGEVGSTAAARQRQMPLPVAVAG
jgi:tRNA-2-methylthio-N6-dimethylallyladenosine synthase